MHAYAILTADCAAERLYCIPYLIIDIVLAHTVRIAVWQENSLENSIQPNIICDNKLIIVRRSFQRHPHNGILVWIRAETEQTNKKTENKTLYQI